MKTLLFAFIAVIILISTGSHVSASRTEFDTNQICDVTGTIQSIEYKEAFKDPCLKDYSCPVGAYNPNQPENYIFSLLLTSVTCEPDKSGIPYSYQSQFSLGNEVEFYILTNLVHNEDSFELGQSISVKVKYFFGHSVISYTIENPAQNNIETEKVESKKSFLEKIWEWFLSLF